MGASAVIRLQLKTMRVAQANNNTGIDLIVETPTEDDLGEFYLATKKQGMIALYYHEGTPTLSQFVAWNTRDQDVCFGYYIVKHGSPARHLVGMAFVHSVATLEGGKVKRVELGLCFIRRRALVDVREHVTPEVMRELAELNLDWAFQQFGATVLFSHTPVKNKASLTLQCGVGFERKGDIPGFTVWGGEPCDSALLILTADRWENFKE